MGKKDKKPLDHLSAFSFAFAEQPPQVCVSVFPVLLPSFCLQYFWMPAFGVRKRTKQKNHISAGLHGLIEWFAFLMQGLSISTLPAQS